jgi:hypothetical protein
MNAFINKRLTKYEHIFDKCYWGGITVAEDDIDYDVVRNRNKFVEEYKISKSLHPHEVDTKFNISELSSYLEFYLCENGDTIILSFCKLPEFQKIYRLFDDNDTYILKI